MPSQEKKSGGSKKYGRNLEWCKMYRAHKTREKNKIKRVLQSNGYVAAVAYGSLHGIPLPKRAEQVPHA